MCQGVVTLRWHLRSFRVLPILLQESVVKLGDLKQLSGKGRTRNKYFLLNLTSFLYLLYGISSGTRYLWHRKNCWWQVVTVHINIHVHVSRQGQNCQLNLLEKSLIVLSRSFEKLLITTGFTHTFVLKINIFCSASSFPFLFPLHCLLLLLLFKKRSCRKEDDGFCLVFLLGII